MSNTITVYSIASCRRCALIIGVSILISNAVVTFAQEWPRFRGINGQGHAVLGDPTKSFITGEEVWRISLPGEGHSSPVLWGERLFLSTADSATGARRIHCFNALDGKEYWVKDFQAVVSEKNILNSFASSTPAADAKFVVATWATPQELTLVALRHTGEQEWKINLGEFKSRHGSGVSPIVFGNMVVLLCDQDFAPSFLVGIDRNSGEIIWKVKREEAKEEQDAAYATPCIYDPPNGGPPQLITFSRPDGINGLDPATGKKLWAYLPAFPYRPVGSPIITDDGLIVGGNPTVVAVRPPSEANAKAQEVFRAANSTSPYVPTMLASKQLLFLWADTGIVQCVDSRSGKLHWKKRIGGKFYSSPILVGECVYCISMEGEMVAIAASAEFKEVGRRSLGEECNATPAVVDGKMYLRTSKSLICLRAS